MASKSAANDVANATDKSSPETDLQALLGVIEDYEKDFKKWEGRSDKIVQRYRDEREINPTVSGQFNILWSNVETAKPLLFSQVPKPIVERRYEKTAPVARVACQIIESSLKTNMDDCDFEAILRQAVQDYQLAARGQLWACYEPQFSDNKMSPEPEQVQNMGGQYVGVQSNQPYKSNQVTQGEGGLFYGQGEAFAPLEYERVFPLYVHYKDFGHNVARYWQEVWIVWRRVYFTRNEAIKFFGEEKGNALPLNKRYVSKDGGYSTNSAKKAEVYEMWDSSDKMVKYVSKEYPNDVLLAKPDPLKLDKFFPCPKPLFGTITNEQLVPVPDYLQYQDQANELDTITERISNLVKAIKVVGVYAGDQKSTIQKMLTAGKENTLIPVEDWLTLQGSGGLAKVIEWMPLDMVAAALMKLYEARDKVKQVIYEITGFADVMRGATDPRETLGAQQLKGKFGTLRISDKQKEVARFSRDIIDIMGQIIANQFDPKTLSIASGIMPEQMPPAQPGAPAPIIPDGAYFGDAVKLLKNNVARHFTIDIEADSTIMPDLDAEKQARTEFLTAVGGFLEKMIPAVKMTPQIAPLLGQMLLFGVRGFRTGRQLEGYVETAVQELDQAAQQSQSQPPAPPPNPKVEEIQAKGQTQAQLIQLQHQAEMEQIGAQGKVDMVRDGAKAVHGAHEGAQDRAASSAENAGQNVPPQLMQAIAQLAQQTQQQGQAIQQIMQIIQQAMGGTQPTAEPPAAPQMATPSAV